MEELEKEKEHEELTKKHRTEKGSLEEKQILEQKLNKGKIQKKGKMRKKCKTSGQNMHGKTETCSHDEHILVVHMAFNYSNMKIVIKTVSTQNTKCQMNLFLSRLTDDNSNKGAVNESKFYGHHYAKIVIYPEKTLRIYYGHR